MKEATMIMRSKLMVLMLLTFGTALQLHAQGYLVPNGVTAVHIADNVDVRVIQNPTNGDYTDFRLAPVGVNGFIFSSASDEGVRVFLVSLNDPMSQQAILTSGYTELMNPNGYGFDEDSPFYVGLYTSQYYPVNGVYPDPLFGWAQLVNIGGVIELLGGELEYGGGGIITGTQTIIPVPEPATLEIFVLGSLLFGWHWRTRIKDKWDPRQSSCGSRPYQTNTRRLDLRDSCSAILAS
jgi:PEP-CTERM motif